jgi:plastocyanin
MRLRPIYLAASPLLLIACACGSNANSNTNTKANTNAGTKTNTSANASTSATAGATRQLGSISVNDHGTTSVSGKTSVTIEADNFYFSPSFISGDPGQKVEVQLKNDAPSTMHNFSVDEQNVNVDLDPGKQMSASVTIPQSGVLVFFCEYHHASGMNGELLSGSTQPQSISAPSATPAASQKTSQPYRGGY